MDPAVHQLIEAVHRAPFRCVLAVTGGGASAVARLLAVPGGSRTVLEARVPYGEQAMVEYLGYRPEGFCSAAIARDMAVRAEERAAWLAPGQPVVGIGCTASLATDRPKRGDHRFYLAVRVGQRLAGYHLTLSKGARGREEEEDLLCRVLLNALAEAVGVRERLEVSLSPGEAVVTESAVVGDALEAFFKGELAALQVDIDGRMRNGIKKGSDPLNSKGSDPFSIPFLSATASRPTLLVPGAFNPLHAGHRGLAAAAARVTGLSVAYELSVVNVDKPPLSVEEVRRRLQPFAWHAPVWLTRAASFAEKASVFPGAVFAVGVDTAVRIVAARYYHDSEEHLAAALAQIRAQGCKFLVAGRADRAGRFVGFEDAGLPEAHRDLFTGLAESAFRFDLSSTELRGERQNLPKD